MYLIKCKLVLFLAYFAGFEAAAIHDGKERQSPIDINRRVVHGGIYPDLEFLFNSTGPLTLESTGYTLKLKALESKHYIKGGSLKGTYQFKELYFHWGTENDKGSEHTIKTRRYPMEMQVVHRNIERADDLVIVAYLFVISKTDNLALVNLVKVAESAAQNPGKPIEVSSFPVDSLVLPFPSLYYSYDGSLTISPYTENVTWIVTHPLQGISQEQLNVFRKAAEHDKNMVNNFRPVQPLNDRWVIAH